MAVSIDLPSVGGDNNDWGDKLNSALQALQNGVNALPDGSGFTQKANNLSDLASASTARVNLGLGSIATANADDFVATPTSGVASTVTFLRGDGTWSPVNGGSSVPNIAIDTDGVPYFSSGASGAFLTADTDGVPFFTVS